MSFWINERLGIGTEFTEAGEMMWDPESKSFNKPISKEIDAKISESPSRRVSEAEALDFANSHDDRHASA